MPELPEIETIRRDIEKALVGEVVADLTVYDRRLLSKKEESRFKTTIPGHLWRSFHRKGKYLWVELDNEWKIIFHLRMTGQLLIGNANKPRITFQFASGKTFHLCDQRRFAEVWLLSPDEVWRARNPLGPDALTELTLDHFVDLIKSRTTRIQPLLMDQRLLAGVGNIYAQEALFKASIRPTRPGLRVTKAEATKLYETLQETLQTAISYRGSSSRNYRDANGDEGAAQTLHAVYRKGGKPCPRCQNPLRSSRVGGRGTVFCSQCQK